MTACQMTLEDLKQLVTEFVQERDWEQFHTPKNLSMALTVEAAELMEHFQWLTPEQTTQLSAEKLRQAGEELADVVLYALSLANSLQLDLTETILAKLEKNRQKYPKELVRGKACKYTEYQCQKDEE